VIDSSYDAEKVSFWSLTILLLILRCFILHIIYSQPLIVAPNQVFGGWREGLLQMKEGGTWEFYMTVDEQQAAAVGRLGVSAGFVLIYTFELLEVTAIVAAMKGPNVEGRRFLAAKKAEEEL
jgi:hypothetical protein